MKKIILIAVICLTVFTADFQPRTEAEVIECSCSLIKPFRSSMSMEIKYSQKVNLKIISRTII